MKRCLLSFMLLMLISFSQFMGPSEEIAQYSFNPTDEPTISTVYTIVSSDVITQSAQMLIPKWQTEFLFSSTNNPYILKGNPISIKFKSRLFSYGKIAGFICVVQHKSNYLS